MTAILFLTGTTRGDALGGITRGLSRIFTPLGYETIEINLVAPDSSAKLEKALQEKQILFAFSFAGIGRDIMLPSNGRDENLWQLLDIPFIAIHGDSPAYFFDRHVNAGPGFATLYGFREHFDLRKQLPKRIGLFGVVPPLMLDVVSETEIDFKQKESGKLIFLKNGNDPKKIRDLWKRNCPTSIANMLFEIADVLDGAMESDEANDLDGLVTGLFANRGMDVTELTKLRLFFVAQLDDYLRRIKSTLMGEVLRDFDVEIHGDNWEHVDFSGSKCTFVPVCDYAKSRGLIQSSLGIVDMSPNTSHGFHDRPLRAYGMHTLCLTNDQEVIRNTFGEDSGVTYTLTRENIADKIADAIAHPKDYVELGRLMARSFHEQYPPAIAAQYFVDVAGALKIGAMKQIHGMQDFFVWPPQSLS